MNSIIKNKVFSKSTYKRKLKKSLTKIRAKGVPDVNFTKSNLVEHRHQELSSKHVISDSDCDSLEEQSAELGFDLVKQTSENISKNLKNWAVKYNLTHVCLRDLLDILHCSHPCLPLEPRTFLHTSIAEKQHFFDVPPGRYWHFGLVRALTKVFESIDKLPTEIFLDFNIDGIPVSKSFNEGQFWPILCSPEGFSLAPFVIGVYYGMAKPSKVDEFLKLFLQEAKTINNLNIGSKTIKFKIRNFICDAPVRSYLKGIKGHDGYFACERCNVEGDYSYNTHQMCFPNLSKSVRTNVSFRNKIHEDHHIQSPSPLESLPIDMINNFPLDYMHLICLGIMKKLLLLWIKNGSLKTNLSSKNIEKISDLLVSMLTFMPCEFNRTVRRLDVISIWKATEFRTFLLYLGPIVLKNEIHQDLYENFMQLHCAVSICLSEKSSNFINIAQILFKSFIQGFAKIYGSENISYNIHNLYHIADDVKFHGPLDNISAFKYENCLQYLKHIIRSENRTLEQIANKISEDFENTTNHLKTTTFPRLYNLDKHKICEIKGCKAGIYRAVEFEEFVLKSSDEADCYFLTKSEEIVRMEFATFQNDIAVIYGSSLAQKQNFYDKPFYSKFLNVYKSNGETKNVFQFWKTDDIVSKYFKVPLNTTESVFFPLIHSLKKENVTSDGNS
ncbi:uncharacterized protein LOC129911712 [Episyrphus balteatus]|uniref:uncharacterized protein LOC129911712 n=1 Tax=Episyrphus balteatus TaxID=286459 RepID=UPI0024869A57|nr:uncharacterized protein LOC129911712 [Episyrphus balteatus]